jgi:hypothetical protein
MVIHQQNSDEHEHGKLEVCLKLLREGKEFITEAVPNDNPKLRHDVICLDDGVIFEIETDPKRAERFNGMNNIVVVALWKDSSKT